jgi:hypothetical protein
MGLRASKFISCMSSDLDPHNNALDSTWRVSCTSWVMEGSWGRNMLHKYLLHFRPPTHHYVKQGFPKTLSSGYTAKGSPLFPCEGAWLQFEEQFTSGIN